MIGFSVPQGDTVLIISYEGMHLLHLGPPITVETDNAYADYDLFDPDRGISHYKDRDWEIIGLHPGRPLLTSPRGERLEVDQRANTISVFLADKEVWSSTFQNFSGDWAAATFSPDGRFIILGCPYDFDFRVWKRTDTRDSR